MYHIIFFAILSILAEGQVVRYLDDAPENIKDSATVTKEWNQMETLLKDLVNNGIRMLMPVLLDNMEGVNISSSCIKQTLQVIGGIRKLQPWAMRFLDSSAKSLDGALTATLYSFGDYDECIDTVATNQHSNKNKEEVMFTGKYCILRIKPPLPSKKPSVKTNDILEELREVVERGSVIGEVARYAQSFYDVSLRLGLCIPSGCIVDDINQLFAKVSSATGLYMKVQRCEVKEEIEFTPLMISVICVYGFVGLLVFIATLTDLYYYYSFRQKPNSTPARVLFAFSFLSNFRKLADTSTPYKNLSCLNGIRFLSMAWIILGHTYLLMIYEVVGGLEYARELIKEFAIQAIVNGAPSVQTFFFIGGFLVCHNATNHVKIASKNLNIKQYVLSRLWRILPAYAFTIMFTFLLPLISSGPIAYNTLQREAEDCKTAWWSKLLFISNLHHEKHSCAYHGWFLTVDMQLYIGALVILLPLFRWPKVGAGIALACAAGFMITTAVITYKHDFPATFLPGKFDSQETQNYFEDLQVKPYPHASSYIIGIMAGYLVAMHPKLKLPKMIQIFFWPSASILAMLVLFGTYEWNGGRDATFWERIVYSSCHRTAFGISIAWLVICCATGHGGIVNYILSWKVWIPLGRLTFVAYLIHPFVQVAFNAHIRKVLAPKHVMAVWIFFGHLMATYGIAFVGSMLIESPFSSLGKLIFSHRVDNRLNSNEIVGSRETIDNMENAKGKGMEHIHNIYVPQMPKEEDKEIFVCRL